MTHTGGDDRAPPRAARRAPATPTARAGAALLVGAGAAVAVLQVLQGVIGQFNPRPAISALITIGVAAASLALDRLRTRRQRRLAIEERRRKLERALVCWPPPLVPDANPYALGVFPRRRDLPADDRYVPRNVDDRLVAAIKQSPFVVVYGPKRSGKSRTALEAAAKALPDAIAVAPNDEDGLRTLLDLQPPMEPTAPQAVLWLDSLERYDEVVDSTMLELLHEIPLDVTIVATIRDDAYRELLSAAGERGDAARAVASAARAFELPAELTTDELRDAHSMYPGEKVDQGLGPCFATAGTEEDAPPVVERKPLPELPDTDGAVVKDPLFTAPTAVALASLALIGIVSLAIGFQKPEPPTIAERADAIKHDLVASGRSVITAQKVTFHGDPSYLFIFHDKRFSNSGPSPSDEIRIYDQRGSKLVERFHFQPREPGFLYQYRYLGDLDSNDEVELYGGFGRNAESSLALLPFILRWDDESASYQITTLQADAPTLTTGVNASSATTPYVNAYRQPVTLTDQGGRTTLSGYRVQDFAITSNPDRYVRALAVKVRTPDIVGRVELQGYGIDLTGERPNLIPCAFGEGRPLFGSWSPTRFLSNEVRERWEAYLKRHQCGPH
jgi:hypothetical protein